MVIPDHVLVRQTMLDCLHEAMDIDGLVALLEQWSPDGARSILSSPPNRRSWRTRS